MQTRCFLPMLRHRERRIYHEKVRINAAGCSHASVHYHFIGERCRVLYTDTFEKWCLQHLRSHKTTGNGVAAGADVSGMTTNATFHFRVWKSSPVWQASDGVRKTGTGHVTMTTLYDNYGQPRLWKGVSYYLAVTHSQYSNVSSGSTCGEWNP